MRFHLVDRIVELETGHRARAIKAVSGSETFFSDHFPGNPVMPGVLVLESMAQTAGALLAVSSDYEQFGLMTLVESLKFRAFVRPGDTLELNATIELRDAAIARVHTTAAVGDAPVAAARITFALVPLGTIIGALYIEGWKQLIASWVTGHARSPGGAV